MISLAFVEGTHQDLFDDPYKMFESFSDSWQNDVDNIFACYEMETSDVMLESELLGDISEDNKAVYEAATDSVFKKIGDKILEIYEKVKELLEKIADKLKSLRFKGKSDAQKLDMMIKKHPEFKDEVIASFKKGDLEFSDMKTLQDMDKAYDELLKLAKQKDIDPNTFKGKVEKVKKAIDNVDKSKAVKVAGAITVTLGSALAIVTFKSKIVEADIRNKKNKADIERLKAEAHETLKNNNVIDDNTGYWQTILSIHREVNMHHAQAQHMDENVVERLSSAIARGLDRITNAVNATATTALHANLNTTSNRADNAATEEFRKTATEELIKNASRRGGTVNDALRAAGVNP